MQKSNKNASILLWAIFISMILSILFLSISTKITKILKNNDNILNQNKINQIINTKVKSFNFNTTKLNNNSYLIFENRNPLRRVIKKNSQITILFNSWATINLKINKIYWADLYYELYQSNDKNNINDLVWSWILSDNLETTLLDSSNNWWRILLKNLWWESKIKIYSQKSILPKYINYKIIKILWNTNIIETENKKQLY